MNDFLDFFFIEILVSKQCSLKEIVSQTDLYLVTYVFEDKMTKY